MATTIMQLNTNGTDGTMRCNLVIKICFIPMGSCIWNKNCSLGQNVFWMDAANICGSRYRIKLISFCFMPAVQEDKRIYVVQTLYKIPNFLMKVDNTL